MNPYLLSIRHTPAILERMLDQIPADRHKDVLNEGRFNLLEIIAHLADWEQILLDRMVLTVKHPGSTLQGYDESERAIEQKYNDKEIYHEIQVFANRRRDTIAFLETLTPEQFELKATHSERGELSLYDQANMIVGHDLYHIEQVSEYLSVLHEIVP